MIVNGVKNNKALFFLYVLHFDKTWAQYQRESERTQGPIHVITGHNLILIRVMFGLKLSKW